MRGVEKVVRIEWKFRGRGQLAIVARFYQRRWHLFSGSERGSERCSEPQVTATSYGRLEWCSEGTTLKSTP